MSLVSKITECIIIGGGSSIKEGLSLGLRDRLQGKFVIACNYAYKHFPHTFLAFLDRDFYKSRSEINNPDIYEELKQEPLIIGIDINGISEFKLDNTILLDKSERENLTGVFALKLAEKIMNSGTIFLLGFDWDRRTGLPERDPNYSPKTDLPLHYYDDIKHRGSGFIGYYENHRADKEFTKLIKKDVKIFNVSLQSNITCFEKISYEHMFTLLNEEKYNQEELRLSYINYFK